MAMCAEGFRWQVGVAGLNPSHRLRNCGLFLRRVASILADAGEAHADFWLSAPQVTVTMFPTQVIAKVGEEGALAGGSLGIGWSLWL